VKCPPRQTLNEAVHPGRNLASLDKKVGDTKGWSLDGENLAEKQVR